MWRLGQGKGLILPIPQHEHLAGWALQGFLCLPASDVGQGAVQNLDAPVGIQDHDPFSAVVDDGRQRPPFFACLLVQLGIAHGDGGLVGKGSKQGTIVGRKGPTADAKDIDGADQFLFDDQWQGDHLAEGQAGRSGDHAEPHLQVGDVPAGGRIVQLSQLAHPRQVGPQGLEEADQAGGQAVAGPNLKRVVPASAGRSGPSGRAGFPPRS